MGPQGPPGVAGPAGAAAVERITHVTAAAQIVNADGDWQQAVSLGTFTVTGTEAATVRAQFTTSKSGASSCVFVLRLDDVDVAGNAGPGPGGAYTDAVRIPSGPVYPVTLQSVFPDVAPGPHELSVWVKTLGAMAQCFVNNGDLGSGGYVEQLAAAAAPVEAD